MSYLYTLLLYLLAPFFVLRLWWKSRKNPAYAERISERFCKDLSQAEANQTFDIWIHAVSLGEVLALVPLIEALLKKNKRLLITTMTPTGADAVRMRFQDRVAHRYAPYDLPSVLQRFFKTFRPKIGIIMETEIWPNLMASTSEFGLPVLLVNARLSERSFLQYKKFRFFFKPVLNQFAAILAQGKEDAGRFMALGADEARVKVFGNIKFDQPIHTINRALADRCKQGWGENRPLLMVASTHDNEEEQILLVWKSLQKALPEVLLLIAPRHPERFETVFQLAKKHNFNTGLCSRPESLGPQNEVVILDSMGQLLPFYQIADYAFVGGSLVPVGGHNVLEPIAMGTPVFSGKLWHNFKSICESLEGAKAIVPVDNAKDLVEKIEKLHQDPKAKETLVANASRVLEAGRGVVQRYVEKIDFFLEAK